MPRKELTERERLVIEYAALTGENSAKRLYLAAYDGALEGLQDRPSFNSAASHWWAKDRVQEFYKEKLATIQARRNLETERIKNSLRAEMERNALAASGLPDYSDSRLQVSKLNEIIANGDANTQLDALKLLMGKASAAAKEGETKQIQRFYTPLRCHACPLYRAEKTRIETNKNK